MNNAGGCLHARAWFKIKRIKILGDYYHLSRTQLVEASLARSALEKLDQYSKRIQNQKAECLFANKLLRAKSEESLAHEPKYFGLVSTLLQTAT